MLGRSIGAFEHAASRQTKQRRNRNTTSSKGEAFQCLLAFRCGVLVRFSVQDSEISCATVFPILLQEWSVSADIPDANGPSLESATHDIAISQQFPVHRP